MYVKSQKLVAALALVVLVTASFAASATGTPSRTEEDPSRFLVTFRDGVDAEAIADAGGTLVDVLDGGTIALVETASPERAFRRALQKEAAVDAVEPDVGISAQGVRWEGVRWEGVRWEGVRWEGVRWEGVRWEGIRWEGVRWEGIRWEGQEAQGIRWEEHGTDDPGLRAQWGHLAVYAPEAWARDDPANAPRVCIPDTGVDPTHPELEGRIALVDGAPGYDFVHDRPGAFDDAGHGTHVAGTVAAERDNGIGIAGVSSASILPAKILDAEGRGSTGDLIRALDWCAENDADVILLALTEDAPTQALRKAVNDALAEDVLIVAAAGNKEDCKNCVGYPAAYPGVLAVGSLNMSGDVSRFSPHGPELDILAPGESILSTLPDERYMFASGTSMAAAYAAGVAALVWSAHPDASARDVAGALCAGVAPGSDPGRSHTEGWGLPTAVDAMDVLGHRGTRC